VPGLTGLWQVSGKNRTTFDEMVQLDIAYGETLSLTNDMGIIFRTLPAIWMQITDTRRARRQLERLSAPPAYTLANDSRSRTATTLINSRNVMGGTLDDGLRLSPQAACVSYQPAKQGMPGSHRVDQMG
jgi:hypothetical protein